MVMVGPDPSGFGGISRVITIWKQSNFLEKLDVKYVSTVFENKNKIASLLRSILQFIIALANKNYNVYIHTASRNSFHRKSLFILIAVLANRKVILHIHPSFFIIFISNFGSLKKRYYFWLLSKVTAFVVLTDEMKTQINNHFPRHNVYVLRNPVDMKELQPHKYRHRVKKHILFLGWYVKNKGVYDLVDACHILNSKGVDFKLDFYGKIGINDLKAYISEKGLTDKICVNGWAENNEKLSVLHKCSFLVLPSHTEGIPNVILEAMATKTPIISTLVGGLKEILRDRENALIVNVSDPTDLSNKILLLIDDPILGEHLSNTAYNDCKMMYDARIIKDQFYAIINKHF